MPECSLGNAAGGAARCSSDRKRRTPSFDVCDTVTSVGTEAAKGFGMRCLLTRELF